MKLKLNQNEITQLDQIKFLGYIVDHKLSWKPQIQYMASKISLICWQTLGETLPIVPMFMGLSGDTSETAKIAHESHNDVRRLCWHAGAIFILLAELGLRKPPSGNPEGLTLLGEGCTLIPASAVVKQSL